MKTKTVNFPTPLAWTRVGLLCCVLLAGPAGAEPSTFTVQEGATPWHDRAGQWTLLGVPESLKNTGPVPQQSCSSRRIEVPGAPASILVGVDDRDASDFRRINPTAEDTGMTVSVANTTGALLHYFILRIDQPSATIAGGQHAGLLLLQVTAGEGAANPSVPPPPPPAESATAPAQTSVSRPTAEPAKLRPFRTDEGGPLRVYLLMGQSNMVGRDTSGLDAQTEDERIGFIGRDGQWWVAREPMHDGGSGIGPGIFFAREMLRMNPMIRVGLVPCAVGGSPLSRWEKGGDLHEKALARAQAARSAGALTGILWHQGESDSDTPANADSYQTRLTAMFADFRAALGEPDLPIVVGQLGDFVSAPKADTVRQALRTMPGRLPRVAFVDSVGLADKGDRLHFGVSGARELGVRYALVMRALSGSEE